MENEFTEQFRGVLAAEQNKELERIREHAFGVFTAMGFPAPKSEDWKYTSVAPITRESWKVGIRASPI